jgi:hypothetical protein
MVASLAVSRAGGSDDARRRSRWQGGCPYQCRVQQEAEAVLGRPVEASKKRKEAGLRRRSRDLPGQTGADEARQGDGGAVVFQRARQIGGGQRQW